MKLFRAPFALGVGILILAGCDFPTETPSLEQRWILPVETTTIGVDELLPAGVTVSGGNFVMSVDAFSTSQTLGGICGACGASNGLTVPKPAFTSQFTVDQALPADVTSASLTGGTIQISVQNGFSFDPIRLASGATGTVTITVTDGPGGAQIGQVVFDGATEAMAAGATVSKTMTLATATVGSTLSAAVDINSPAGAPTDLVTINTAESLTVTATPSDILVGSATVNVNGQSVDLEPVDLDVEDMDDAMTDRIQQGSVILDVVNPFGVSVNGTVNIGPTTKPFSIASTPTSTLTISYTGDELRSFLGQPNVQFSGSGTISASAPIAVTPGQEVTLKASIDLTVIIG